MKKGIPIGLSLLLVLAGCSSVRTVDFTGKSTMSHEVTTRDGYRTYGADLVRRPDSIVWTDHAGGRRALARSEIRGVRPMPGRASARTWMESLDEINKRALTRQARVILSDGTDYSADQLQVARDTATWFDPRTRRLYSIPTTSIAFVHFRDGKRGTLRGLAGGVAAGALGGFVIGFASGNDPDDQFFAFSAAEKAVALGVVFGVLGAPVGAVVGSGSKISYRFDGGPIPKSPDRASPTEPIASRRPGDVDPKVAPPPGDVDPQAAPPPGDVDPQMAPPPEGAVLDTNPTPEDTSPDSESPPGDTVMPMERPPEHASLPAVSSWSVSVLGAGAVGGGARGLEKAMRATGFDKNSGCFLFCGSGDNTGHPHSSVGSGWLIDVHRGFRSRKKMGFLVSKTGGETFGYDGSQFLFIRHTVMTYATVFSLQAFPALRIGLGPALHRVGSQKSSGLDTKIRHQSRLGLVADLAVVFPADTRFFLDVRAQYRLVGSADVGPFEEEGFDQVSSFPASRVGFNHGFFGAGFGVRF